MAYFDSPKNRVLWEMELKDLRKQRADFEAGRLDDFAGAQTESRMGDIGRKPVTLEQLEREEAAASKSARREAAKPRERERERRMEMAPERSRDAPVKAKAPMVKAKSAKGR